MKYLKSLVLEIILNKHKVFVFQDFWFAVTLLDSIQNKHWVVLCQTESHRHNGTTPLPKHTTWHFKSTQFYTFLEDIIFNILWQFPYSSQNHLWCLGKSKVLTHMVLIRGRATLQSYAVKIYSRYLVILK